MPRTPGARVEDGMHRRLTVESEILSFTIDHTPMRKTVLCEDGKM